jgi:hypothetical protein
MLALLAVVGSFDRYRDRYQNGNPRTIEYEVDITFPLTEGNGTRRTQHSEPHNPGPGNRRFKSCRPDHHQ